MSLVPSATESLRAIGIDPVGCTRFCEQVGIPTVGGTKDPDIAGIISLMPDLVVVNEEENRFDDAARLLDAGIALHSMSPRAVADVGPAVVALADACGVAAPGEFAPVAWTAWLARQRADRAHDARTVCTFVWRRPWTAAAGTTYGSSLLDLLGFANVFESEPDRYPVVTLDEVAMCHPDVIVLPDEPYPFKARHVAEVEEGVPGATPMLVDGRDLFWWGVRTPSAVDGLRDRLS